MKNKKIVIGLALQLVYDYPSWDGEMVEDMIKTYDDMGENRPCDVDTLFTFCNIADKLKKENNTWEEAEKIMNKSTKKTMMNFG
jgi:hypothetical protein